MEEHTATLQVLQTMVICGRNVLIGGDCNCIFEKEDKTPTPNSTVKLDRGSHVLKELLDDCDLTHPYRLLIPNLSDYT